MTGNLVLCPRNWCPRNWCQFGLDKCKYVPWYLRTMGIQYNGELRYFTIILALILCSCSNESEIKQIGDFKVSAHTYHGNTIFVFPGYNGAQKQNPSDNHTNDIIYRSIDIANTSDCFYVILTKNFDKNIKFLCSSAQNCSARLRYTGDLPFPPWKNTYHRAEFVATGRMADGSPLIVCSTSTPNFDAFLECVEQHGNSGLL